MDAGNGIQAAGGALVLVAGAVAGAGHLDAVALTTLGLGVAIIGNALH